MFFKCHDMKSHGGTWLIIFLQGVSAMFVTLADQIPLYGRQRAVFLLD